MKAEEWTVLINKNRGRETAREGKCSVDERTLRNSQQCYKERVNPNTHTHAHTHAHTHKLIKQELTVLT